MRFNKIISAALAAVITAGSITAAVSAESAEFSIKAETYAAGHEFTLDGFTYDFHSDGTVYVKSYSGNKKTITMPTSVEGFEVTGAYSQPSSGPKSAQPFSTDAENITIPGTYVRGFNLKDCANLKKVTIKSGVKEISPSAFENCKSLETVVLPDSVTEIREYAFEYCEKLTTIKLPDSIEKIGSMAFYGSGLKELELPAEVYCYPPLSNMPNLETLTLTLSEATGNLACPELSELPKLETLVIPQGINHIMKISYCGGLKSIYIPKSVGYVNINDCPQLEIYYEGSLKEWLSVRVDGDTLDYPIHYNSKMPAIKTSAKPTAPENVKATKTESALKISWSKNENATSYTVQYSTDNKTWKSKTVKTNSATITGLKANTKYYYKVAAKNGEDTSDYTKTYTATTSKAATAKPAKVTGVKATAAKNSVKLTWSKATGAAQYVIKYSTDGKTWQTVTTESNSTSYTIKKLTAGTKYYYKVAAKNSKGTGTYSSQGTATTKTK